MMRQLNLLTIITIFCFGTLFTSCVKENATDIKVASEEQIENQFNLNEFLTAEDLEKVRQTFADNMVVDHSDFMAGNDIATTRDGGIPMIVYRGFWWDVLCFGHMISWCGSLGHHDGLPNDMEYVYGAVSTVGPDKVKITFDSENTGFTVDGFLPLNHDLPISDEMALLLGIPLGSYVAQATYVADFDPQVGYHNSVIVDIN